MTAGTVPWRWTLTCKLTDHWSIFICIMIPYQTGKPQKHERSWVVNTSFSIYLTLSAHSNFVPRSVCTALFCPWMVSCCRTHFVLEQSCKILHNIKDLFCEETVQNLSSGWFEPLPMCSEQVCRMTCTSSSLTSSQSGPFFGTGIFQDDWK